MYPPSASPHEQRRPKSFPLRLPPTRARAVEIAKREGISLNQFIVLGVGERLTRFEVEKHEGKH